MRLRTLFVRIYDWLNIRARRKAAEAVRRETRLDEMAQEIIDKF